MSDGAADRLGSRPGRESGGLGRLGRILPGGCGDTRGLCDELLHLRDIRGVEQVLALSLELADPDQALQQVRRSPRGRYRRRTSAPAPPLSASRTTQTRSSWNQAWYVLTDLEKRPRPPLPPPRHPPRPRPPPHQRTAGSIRLRRLPSPAAARCHGAATVMSMPRVRSYTVVALSTRTDSRCGTERASCRQPQTLTRGFLDRRTRQLSSDSHRSWRLPRLLQTKAGKVRTARSGTRDTG